MKKFSIFVFLMAILRFRTQREGKNKGFTLNYLAKTTFFHHSGNVFGIFFYISQSFLFDFAEQQVRRKWYEF